VTIAVIVRFATFQGVMVAFATDRRDKLDRIVIFVVVDDHRPSVKSDDAHWLVEG